MAVVLPAFPDHDVEPQNACVESVLNGRYPYVLICMDSRSVLDFEELSQGDLVSNDINILALAKGEERYIFLYNDRSKNETLRTLGRYASNSELSFSWYDAAVMSQKVRKNKSTTSEMPAAISRFEASAVEDLLSGEEPFA